MLLFNVSVWPFTMQPPLAVPAFKPKVSVTSFSVSPVLRITLKGIVKMGVLFPPLMMVISAPAPLIVSKFVMFSTPLLNA